jgi:acetylornithine deacetylase
MAQTLAQIELAGRLDAAIDRHAAAAHALLEGLVAEPSVLGSEAGPQEVLAAELARLGFDISWVEIPETIAADPAAGVPQLPYAGRRVLVGRRAGLGAGGRSLLFNGHVDVVPAGDPDAWSSPPFTPTRVDGWLRGRGAGDMKAGFAMVTLAVESVLEAGARPLADLTVVATIEEECTGNGTLATVRAGVLADAVVLPEPTDLCVLTSGVGVLWVDVVVAGSPTHAETATAGVSALERIEPVLTALRGLAEQLNRGLESPRYHVNVGELHAGEWPSTVPGSATLRVRVGFPPDMSPDEALARTRAAIAGAAAADDWLRAHPPDVRPSGFRAAGYALADDADIVQALRAAHVEAHREPPPIVGTNATTDARFYLNQAGVPALCFGPRTRGMHGVDEAVELASIAAGARTLARLMVAWMGVA